MMLPLLPDDDANRALVAATHPPAWSNPRPARRYDLVVIGGGPAGLVSAAGAAGLGARVALVERHLMGGDCLVSGCVPSKALLRAASAVVQVREARALGILASEPVVDFPGVMATLRARRAEIAPHDSVERFAGLGVDVHLGQGRFVARDAVEVAGQRLRFRRAIVATGARPTIPAVPGLDPQLVLTSETVWSLTELPARLVVLGGGPIGAELAQAFRRFGSVVDLVTTSDRLLPRDEPDAAALVAARFAAEGVGLHLAARVTRVEHGPEHRLTVVQGDRTFTLVADAVLVAVGRRPNVEGLELVVAGVRSGPSGVEVNDRLRTSNRRIFAAGDVASRLQFTHAADALARIAVQNALFFGWRRASSLVVPWVTYTDPEVAHVGWTTAEAMARGLSPVVLREPFADNDRAVVDGEPEGFAELRVGAGGRLLGATVVGRHAGDLVSELSLAMTAGLRVGALSSAIHPYPTRSEIWKRLGDRWMRSRLTPSIARALRAWFALGAWW